MQWTIVYLIVSIFTLIFAIWNMAQGKNFFLSLIGIIWFLIILSMFFIPQIYNLVLIQGLPTLGNMLLYPVLPVFLIFSFMRTRSKT